MGLIGERRRVPRRIGPPPRLVQLASVSQQVMSLALNTPRVVGGRGGRSPSDLRCKHYLSYGALLDTCLGCVHCLEYSARSSYPCKETSWAAPSSPHPVLPLQLSSRCLSALYCAAAVDLVTFHCIPPASHPYINTVCLVLPRIFELSPPRLLLVKVYNSQPSFPSTHQLHPISFEPTPLTLYPPSDPCRPTH